jgi:hypothetical protein
MTIYNYWALINPHSRFSYLIELVKLKVIQYHKLFITLGEQDNMNHQSIVC